MKTLFLDVDYWFFPMYRSSIVIGLLSYLVIPAVTAQAQILPDQTMGSEASSITPDQLVRGNLADLIEGGATRGGNLFHSFSEFNIDDGQRVYFANPAEIEAILSRVTGTNPSEIFGTLGVDGSADLFLINPNGLIFGENAQLDIPGSFYGTTAEAVELGNSVFSPTAPEQSQLLAVNPSVSFWNYLTENSGNITNRGALAVEGDLVLAGNQLDLESQVAAVGDVSLLATDTIKIRDTAETPFIAFAGEDLLVQGNQQVDIIALSHPNSGLFSYGDMVLRSAEGVGGDAHYLSGSNFRIEQLDGSGGELFSPIDPIIRAYGNVEIEEYFGSSLHILAGGSVTIGSAILNEPEAGEPGVDFLRENIQLSDGTTLEIDGGAQATLDVRAGVRPEVIGPFPGVFDIDPTSNVFTGLNIAESPVRADINVSAISTTLGSRNGLVLLTNQYQPNTSLLGGDIRITPEGLPDSLPNLQNLSVGVVDLTNINPGEEIGELEGDGGSIFLDSRDNITVLSSTIFTQSSGDVGDVVVIADDTVTLDGLNSNVSSLGIYTGIVPGGNGIGGDVQIRAENLELLNGFQVASYVDGSGQGGDIAINIQETLTVDGGSFSLTGNMSFISSQIATGIRNGGDGQSGNIQITAENLEVTEGARITSDALGNGRAGDINLSIRGIALLRGSDSEQKLLGGISSDALSIDGRARSGNIYIAAGDLDVSNGADITTTTFGVGDAGDIELQVRETARFEGVNPSTGKVSGVDSRAESGAEGQAGDIRIAARNIEVLNGAELNASTFGIGDAGNIILKIEEAARFEGVNPVDTSRVSFVGSTVPTGGIGKGGTIQISAANLEVLNSAQLSTSVFGTGDAGNITLDIRETAQISGASPANGNGSLIASAVSPGGQGNGGNIQIAANNLEVTDGGQLISVTSSRGDAGNVVLDIRDTVRIEGSNPTKIDTGSGIFSGVGASGEGQGGNIQITAATLEVLDSAQLVSSTSGSGNGGDILINTRESVRFAGVDSRDKSPSAAFSSAEAGSGRGGNIQITTSQLDILDGAQLASSTNVDDNAGNISISADELNVIRAGGLLTITRGTGDAGDIILDIAGTAQFSGVSPSDDTFSGLASNVGETGSGTGGDIFITASALKVLDGAQLNAGTFGAGDAGNVVLTIQETAQFEGIDQRDNSPSGVFSSTDIGSIGKGGDVRIIARNLEVLNEAQLSAGVAGRGNGGDIILTIADTVRFDGGDSTGALTTIQESGIGQGGDLHLSAANLLLLNGAVASAGSRGQGNSGNVVINVRDVIQARNGDISTRAESSAGGQIQVNAGNIFLFGDSDIRSFVTSGADNGGDITIIADAVVALDDSDILAFAADGRGGNVDLSRTAFFGQDFSLAPFGTDPRTLDGNNRVDINATGRLASGNILLPDVSFIQNTLTELPDNLVNPETLVSNSCIARSNDTASSFTLTGSDGLPSDSPQPSYSLSSVQPTAETTNIGQDTPVIEPHQVYQLSDGRLVMSRECNEMD